MIYGNYKVCHRIISVDNNVNVRYDVFKVVNIKLTVFWGITRFSCVDRYVSMKIHEATSQKTVIFKCHSDHCQRTVASQVQKAWIERAVLILWLPRSPDLTPCCIYGVM